jgi:hypothetical protein
VGSRVLELRWCGGAELREGSSEGEEVRALRGEGSVVQAVV